ncbi:MAG: hypothetical protein FVQ81_05490 [Candidatus Glassbacteria bacterium]|nr:hypothetical protein [Candidatus Glassbacteria bacterium]
MQFITSVAAKVVKANATVLDGALAQGATTVVVAHDVFTAVQSVRIGEEQITLGSTSDNLTFTGCTRGAASTTDTDHADGQEVLDADGAELLSHTFDGSTYLSAIRISANVQFTCGIEQDGTLRYMPRSSHSQMELILPTARYQPAGSSILTLLAWLRRDEAEEADFSAEMQS